MRLVAILLFALALGRVCPPGGTLSDSVERPDEQTAAAAEHTMSGAMAEDLHRDIRIAQADGFRQFIPGGAAPAAVGGRFRPRLLGWMVHVMAFGHQHDEHMH